MAKGTRSHFALIKQPARPNFLETNLEAALVA